MGTPASWFALKVVEESTGLEFASQDDLTRQIGSDSFWLSQGGHPTDSAEVLWWRIQQVRRERLRRLDPCEISYTHESLVRSE